MRRHILKKLCALTLSMTFASSALSSFPLQKAGAWDSVEAFQSYALANWNKPIQDYYEDIIGGRTFGAARSGTDRVHAANDYVCDVGTPVYAMESGTVVEYSGNFYGGTQAVGIEHSDGSVARYCEISTGLRDGDSVSKGEQIGTIIANNEGGGHMLHLELYLGTASGSLTDPDNWDYWYVPEKNYKRRCDLLDPTFLQSLSEHPDDELNVPYPRPTGNVKKGMKGSSVGWVQYTLDFLGYDIGSYGIDCDFGSATESAVKAFQSDHGLDADGIVGEQTRNMIVEKVMVKIEPHGEEMASGYGQCLPDGDYFIFSQLDPNYYVDVSGAKAPADAGTNVAMWHLSDGTLPSAGDAHDAWTLHYVGNGFYTIAQKGTGMYLDVFNADKKRGTNVQLWTGHGGTAQLWSITPTDTGYKIQAKCSSYCLDVAGAGTDNGTNVQVWESNDSGSQRFAFVPFAPSVGQTLADGIYMIQLKADPAFCLDVQGYENKSYTSETNVQLWKTADCNDAFQVTYLGDGYYSICEAISGLTLDVIGVGGGKYLNTGNNIQVYKNNLTRNQKWIIRKASGGGYQIISAYSGYALDMSGGVPELRCQISQYYDNGTKAQIWEFGEALAKPEKSVLSADKASAFTGETVTFTADSDAATGYTIGIDKDGERLITQAMPDGKLSLSFADAGEYSAYVTAYNAMGYCDSKRITFTVKPYELTLYETEKHTIVMQDAGTTYKTSNADVAVVSKNGVITAMGKGAAVITVTDGSAKQVQIVVQVFKAPVTGDCTADGVFDSDDVTALCEWLTTESAQNMNRWENADLNEDGLLTAVDLTLMKQLLLK